MAKLLKGLTGSPKSLRTDYSSTKRQLSKPKNRMGSNPGMPGLCAKRGK